MKKYLIDLNFEVFQTREIYLANENHDLDVNDYAIVTTTRGIEMAKVMCVKEAKENQKNSEYMYIERKATKDDISRYKLLREEAIKAGFIFRNKKDKYDLNIKLVSTEYTFDKQKLIFYFASEDRVDFRELVKDLANIFRVRIELRQIGVRDHAKLVGDCGTCGKDLCCRQIKNRFDSVSIKMAREQSISVTSSKISGVCGRIKCCMAFEHDQYSEKQRYFPSSGQTVKTPIGTGQVISLNIMNDYLFVSIPNKGVNKFNIDEITFEKIEQEEIENQLDSKML